MKKLNTTLILLMLTIISISTKAQIASPNCAPIPTLTTGTYTNLSVTTNSVGWYNYIATGSAANITLINSNNSAFTKIQKIQVFKGACSTLTLIATDSLSNPMDSILSVNLTGLITNNGYKVKLFREARNDENSSFDLNILQLCYCGISYGIVQPTQNSSSPPGNYNGFQYGCFSTLNGPFCGTTIPPTWAICNYNFAPICSQQDILYFGSSSAGSGLGLNLTNNAVFYFFGNTPGSTFSVQATSTGTTQVSYSQFVATGATQFTVVVTDPTCPIPLTPTLTIADIEASCSTVCTQLVITLSNWLPCTFNLPSPICAGQPFCYSNPSPPAPYPASLYIGYGILPFQPASTHPLGCFANGLPAGQYTLSITQDYYADGSNLTCSCNTSTVITVYPFPSTPTITANPASQCNGQSTTLTAISNSATSYVWQPTGSVGSSVPFVVNGNQVYTVTASNAAGCAKSNTILITGTDCCRNPARGSITFNNVTLVPFGTPAVLAWTGLIPNSTYSGISIAIPSTGNIIGNYAVAGFLNVNAATTFSATNIYFSDAAVVNQNQTTIITKSYWHGCTNNWRGISSNAVLNLNNSVIEDASTAIGITGGGTHPGLFVNNTIFNINNVGISVFGKNFANFNVNGNIFTSRNISPTLYNFMSGLQWSTQPAFTQSTLQGYSAGFLKGSVSLGLLNTSRGQYGIAFLGAQHTTSSGNFITVGDVSLFNNANKTNTFDYLHIGILAASAKLNSVNNNFQQIGYVSSIDNTFTITAGIYSSAANVQVGSSAFGAAAVIATNTFVSSNTGVYATNNGTLNVNNNLFTNVSFHAIDVNKWYASTTNNALNSITNNTFTTCLYDLFAFDNNKINLNFSNNASTYPLVTARPRITYHVYIDEIAKPVTAKYNVTFNNSFGKIMGVYCINTYSASVLSNNITVRSPVAANGGFNAPIWLDNTDESDIKSNVLNYTPSNSQNFSTFGIFTSIGVNNLYCENDIKGAGSALKFQGTSPSRIYRNFLNNNPTDPCRLGIFLDANGFVGPINFPVIPGLNATADNQFGDFNFADTYVQSSSLGSQIDYAGAANSFNPFYPAVNLNGPGGAGAFIPFSNNFSGISTCNAFLLNIFQRLSKGVPPFVANAVTFSGNNANSIAIANKSTFGLFRKSNFTTTGIANFNSFMATQQAGAIGAFHKMDSLVGVFALGTNTTALIQATVMNTALVAGTTIDQNQKDFNGIYHTYLKGDSLVTSGQLVTLKYIAALCPFTDGTSVYQARGLLKHYDSTEYFNTCEQNIPTMQSGSRLINSSSNTELNSSPEALSTKVYPNPASTEVTITTELDGASIIILNVLGQVVISMPLTSQTILNVSELKSGTYLFKIVKDDRIIKTDKLIINK